MRRSPTIRETMMRALPMLDSHVVKRSAQGTAVDVAGGLGRYLVSVLHLLLFV